MFQVSIPAVVTLWQVSTAAAHVVSVMSGDEQSLPQLLFHQSDVVPQLLKLAEQSLSAAQAYALEALVNLAQVALGLNGLVKDQGDSHGVLYAAMINASKRPEKYAD